MVSRFCLCFQYLLILWHVRYYKNTALPLGLVAGVNFIAAVIYLGVTLYATSLHDKEIDIDWSMSTALSETIYTVELIGASTSLLSLRSLAISSYHRCGRSYRLRNATWYSGWSYLLSSSVSCRTHKLFTWKNADTACFEVGEGIILICQSLIKVSISCLNAQ